MQRLIACGLLALACPVAQAQITVPEMSAPVAAEAPPSPGSPPPVRESGRLDFKVDPDVYSVISQVRGLSTHKPTFFYPLSYSPDFYGEHTEMVFQISAKQRLFGSNLYLAYTQKSFWQFINQDQSSPFRETNYDPEIFYRWIPDDPKPLNHWGADFGFEHESNGREFPFSRSWNRVYIAPFQAKGKHLAYLKFWYRIPEGAPSSLANPGGDDNPEINDYYGYSELSFSRQIGGDQLLTGQLRGNARTGKGAVSFTWSVPSGDGYVFYGASVFHGYGESLIHYDEKMTRVMLGILLAR
jgi:phospholipase A1